LDRDLPNWAGGVSDGEPALPAAGGLPGAGGDPARRGAGARLLPPAGLGQGPRAQDMGQRSLSGTPPLLPPAILLNFPERKRVS
jgi:hypothetical protein